MRLRLSATLLLTTLVFVQSITSGGRCLLADMLHHEGVFKNVVHGHGHSHATPTLTTTEATDHQGHESSHHDSDPAGHQHVFL